MRMDRKAVNQLLSPVYYDSMETEKDAYFISKWYPDIFRWDKTTNEVVFVAKIPESPVTSWAFKGIFKYKDLLICIPHFEKRIVFYDMEAQTFDFIDLSAYAPNANFQAWVFSICCVQPEILCLVSVSCRRLMLLNMEKRSVSVHDIPYITEEGAYQVWSCFDQKRYVYITYEKSRIIAFDILTGKFEAHDIACGAQDFSTISYDGQWCWLGGTKGAIIKWNPVTKETRVMKDISAELDVFRRNEKDGGGITWQKCEKGFSTDENQFVFNQSYYDSQGDCVWMIPLHSDVILCIDRKEETIEYMPLAAREIFDVERKYLPPAYFMVYADDEVLWLFSEYDGYIYEIDSRSRNIKKISLLMQDKEINDFRMDLLDSKTMLNEDTFFTLEDYLAVDFYKGQAKIQSLDIGAQIYREMI